MKLTLVYALLLLHCPHVRGDADPGLPPPPRVVLPNADGLWDVAGAGNGEGNDPMPNPFRVRYRPQSRRVEVPLVIAGVFVGEKPEDDSAVINGKCYACGDVWEGLTVAAISADVLELRQGRLLLKVPVVQEQPVTVRLFR